MKTLIKRRHFLGLAGAGMLGTASPFEAFGQARFPDRSVTLILSFPPGAIVDNVGRKLAAALSKIWSLPVVCDNRPGAGGNLAGGVVAKSRADGYTLLLSQYDSMVIAGAGNVPIGYDPIADLDPVAQVGLSTTLFLVNSESRFQEFSDFIDFAKQNPGKLNFGSNGIGGSYHLGIEQLNSMANVSIAHIPYRGGAPSMVALLAGEVDAILASTSLAMPQLNAGNVRVLALGSNRRSELYPGVPTIEELGTPGYDVSLGLGIFCPNGVPDGVITQINRDINHVLRDQEFVDQLQVEGVEATPKTKKDFDQVIENDFQKTKNLIEKLNIKLG